MIIRSRGNSQRVIQLARLDWLHCSATTAVLVTYQRSQTPSIIMMTIYVISLNLQLEQIASYSMGIGTTKAVQGNILYSNSCSCYCCFAIQRQ